MQFKSKPTSNYRVEKIHSGTDPCLSCESDFCMNYMSMCAKSGLKNQLCWHLGQVVAANTSFPEPVVLLDEIWVTWDLVMNHLIRF